MASSAVGTAIGRKERCVSCDAPLSGPYCSRCGERVLEPDALTLRHFLFHTVAHELLHLDGTLWQTLRLLFVRPGQLSLEYSAGRRRPYVNPFRLLLIAFVAFALMTASGFHVTLNLGPVITSLAPAAAPRGLSVEDTIARIDQYGLLRQQLARKSDQLKTESARERFHDRLEGFLQHARPQLRSTVKYGDVGGDSIALVVGGALNGCRDADLHPEHGVHGCGTSSRRCTRPRLGVILL